MFPYFNLFGLTLPTYYLIEAIDLIGFFGIAVSLLIFKFKLSFPKVLIILGCCIPLPFFNLFVVGYLEEFIRVGSAPIGAQDYFGFLMMLVPMVLISAKLSKVSEKIIFSSLVPPCAFAASFIKVGCLSTGCSYCRGLETDGLGIRYPFENVTRIPVEIYELVFFGLLFIGLLVFVIRSKKPTFAPFFIFFFAFPIYRFIQDFFRYMPEYFLGLNYSQVNAIVLLVLVLLATLYLGWKERIESEEAATQETR